MASNITKILFRRGTDDQRKLVTLNLGEPGITTDTNRLFVGDGTTAGGFPAGSINLGAVDALAGGGTGGLSPATFTYLQSKRPVAGDFIYDKTTGTIFSLSSFQTPVPSLSDFVPYTSQILFNTSQFTISGTPPGLSLANQGVNNNNLALAQANSVKANATASVASPQDLVVGSVQIVGNTTGTLNALSLSGQSGIKFIPTSSTVLSVTLTGAPQSVKGNIDPGNEGPVSDITFGNSPVQFAGTSTTGILTAVDLIEGDGISFNAGDRDLTVNTTNSIQYLRYGDMRGSSNAPRIVYNAGDGTSIDLYNLSYTTTSFVTFETSALNNKPPLVTVFWMASGASSVTVFATNSSIAASPAAKLGRWSPNALVAGSFRDGNNLYIGGNFTKLGATAYNRFGLINLSGGNTASSSGVFLGATGLLSTIPGTDPFGSKALLNGGAGFNSTVKQILKFRTSAGKEYLCVGGTFTATGIQKGTGLTVFETTNNYMISGFAFTGTTDVRALLSAGDYLYVGGTMTAGRDPGGTGGGAMEGLTRINMTTLVIDTAFTANVNTTFTRGGGTTYPINTLEYYNGVLYAGGYQVVGTAAANYTQIGMTAHLTDTAGAGSLVGGIGGWNPIVKGGSVSKLKIDSNATPPILYTGGNFTTIKTGIGNNTGMLSIPRIAAFSLANPNSPTLLTDWKPTPNSKSTVTQIDIHDTATPGLSAIYVGGSFTKLQSTGVKYLGAVSKADGSIAGGSIANVLNWYPAPGAGLAANSNSSIIRIPYTHPLSGVIFTSNTTSTGGIRQYISRTSGYTEAVVGAVSGVAWSIDGNVIGEGAGLDIDTTYTSIVSDIPGLQDTVQTTTFPALSDSFADVDRGDLCRYKLGRTGTTSTGDTYAKPVWLLGVKIDYNS